MLPLTFVNPPNGGEAGGFGLATQLSLVQRLALRVVWSWACRGTVLGIVAGTGTAQGSPEGMPQRLLVRAVPRTTQGRRSAIHVSAVPTRRSPSCPRKHG